MTTMATSHGRVDIVEWTRRTLDAALVFAERERSEIERARAYHLARAVERGTCEVGHDLTAEPVARNWNGQHPCGYCISAREHGGIS